MEFKCKILKWIQLFLCCLKENASASFKMFRVVCKVTLGISTSILGLCFSLWSYLAVSSLPPQPLDLLNSFIKFVEEAGDLKGKMCLNILQKWEAEWMKEQDISSMTELLLRAQQWLVWWQLTGQKVLSPVHPKNHLRVLEAPVVSLLWRWVKTSCRKLTGLLG